MTVSLYPDSMQPRIQRAIHIAIHINVAYDVLQHRNMSNSVQTAFGRVAKIGAWPKVKECDKTILDSLAADMAKPVFTASAMKALRSLAKSKFVVVTGGVNPARK